MGKKISLIITITITLIGLILVFIPSVDMERFRIFISAISPLLIALMTSIGANAAIKTIHNKEDKDV